MTPLTYLDAVLLGFVQGLTEFLPISSSGHLAMIQHWLDLKAESPQMLLFDVIAHMGTVVAVLIVFAHPAWRFARKIIQESSSAYTGRRYAWRIFMLGVAATIPTGVIGLTFKDWFEERFGDPQWIGVALLITGTLLILTKWVAKGGRGWRRFHVWQAVFVGLAQSFAILPGISRSGSTICVALYLGLRRRWAGEFSFFIATPAILGATVLQLRDTLRLPVDQMSTLRWGPLVVGGLVSMVIGVVALRILLRSLRRAKLHYFAPYCWCAGLFVLWLTRYVNAG